MSDRLHRLLRWPLWSWRNLTFTVVAVLASLGLIGQVGTVLRVDSPREPKVASGVSATSSLPLATPEMLSPSGVPTTASVHPEAAPSGTCELTAEAFVQAWVHTSLSADDWLAGMQPYAAGALLSQLALSDPSRVPSTEVLGSPVVATSSSTAVTVRVLTDAGPVLVTLKRAEGPCLVQDVQPADNVPGAPTPVLTVQPGATSGPAGSARMPSASGSAGG